MKLGECCRRRVNEEGKWHHGSRKARSFCSART
jgi:hypothetical protein